MAIGRSRNSAADFLYDRQLIRIPVGKPDSNGVPVQDLPVGCKDRKRAAHLRDAVDDEEVEVLEGAVQALPYVLDQIGPSLQPRTGHLLPGPGLRAARQSRG